MAHWRDKLQKGSFRGAPFLWQKAEGEAGRKTARHDYPLRDEAYIEDMGKAPREFTLEVYVLGPDYMADRDRLIAALEEPGPGTLIHPTMGTLKVSLNGKARISESTDEGGMARFTLPFVLAGENKYPAAAVDTAGAIATRADAALGKVADDFGQVWSVDKQPEFVANSAQALAETAVNKIGAARRLISPPYLPENVTKFVSTLQSLNGSVGSLIRTPAGFGSELQGFISSLGQLSENPFDNVRAYRGLFDFGNDDKPVTGTTSARVQQAANQQALTALVQRTAVIEAARASSQTEYASYQDAVKTRDELTDRLDAQMEADCCNDAVYTALSDLRVAVIRDINQRGANLARITSYTPQTTLPALVVAHNLYGDATQESEIVVRNRIRHPGFVRGGTPLEVRTNG